MEIYDTVAGGLDHAAGSIDESIGRQFDDDPGGGFADGPSGQGIEVTGGYVVPTDGEVSDERREEIQAAGGKVVDMDEQTWSYTEMLGQDPEGDNSAFQPDLGFDPDLNPTASGDGRGLPDLPEAPPWFDWVKNNFGKLLLGLAVVYVLTLLKPLFEIGATATEVAS